MPDPSAPVCPVCEGTGSCREYPRCPACRGTGIGPKGCECSEAAHARLIEIAQWRDRKPEAAPPKGRNRSDSWTPAEDAFLLTAARDRNRIAFRIRIDRNSWLDDLSERIFPISGIHRTRVSISRRIPDVCKEASKKHD